MSLSLLLQRVARIRPREDLDERLLLLILAGQGFRDYLTPIFTGISVPHFSPEQIRSFLIALPPLPEQSAIIERLDEATTDIAGAINSLLYGVVLALLCSCIGRSF